MARGFVQVDEPDPTPTLPFRPPVQDHEETSHAAEMLALALKGLSQRATIALSNLFTAAGLLSAWWLWSTILPQPTDRQLVGVTLYAVFLLALEFVRRKAP